MCSTCIELMNKKENGKQLARIVASWYTLIFILSCCSLYIYMYWFSTVCMHEGFSPTENQDYEKWAFLIDIFSSMSNKSIDVDLEIYMIKLQTPNMWNKYTHQEEHYRTGAIITYIKLLSRNIRRNFMFFFKLTSSHL